MFPIALIVPIIKTRVPRSVKVAAPTCLAPFQAITLSGFCVVKHPVSSILSGEKWYFSTTSDRFFKKTPTVARLNDVARPSLVATGDLNNKLWRFVNEYIHSLSASLLSD